MCAAAYLLAQGEADAVSAIGWLIIILALVVVMFVATMWVRKHFREEEEPLAAESAPFALGDLKELLRQGKLTQQEYDRLHGQMVEKLKPTTLSLSDLRRMLQEGGIDPEEYERLKAQVVAAMKDPSIPYPQKPKPKDHGQAQG